MAHAELLINRYLDEIITPDEADELRRLLVDDPQVARLFTRMARTENLIFTYFNEIVAERAVENRLTRRFGDSFSLDQLRPKLASAEHWSRLTFKDRYVGALGSVLVHVLLVIFLFHFLVVSIQEQVADIELELVELEIVELEEFQEEVEELTEEEDMFEELEAPEPVMDEAPPDPKSVDAPLADLDFDALTIDADFSSPLVLKGLYAGRTSNGRHAMLGKYGGGYGSQTETAVKKALRWLADHQNDDGSWGAGGAKHVVGITGLSLLTYLAHGETPVSEQYGATVEKAIKHLVARQQPDGSFGSKGYAHGIATYALCEAYALTKIPALRQAMDKAVVCMIHGQGEQGGWNYGYKNDERIDFSVSGWHMQALKAAKLAGFTPEDPEISLTRSMALAIENARAFQLDSGLFGYSKTRKDEKWPENPDQGRESMTGVGVLCLQLLGLGRDSCAKQGLAALANAECTWEKGWGQGLHSCRTYTWYYITQAKFHAGKKIWKKWNNLFAPEFVKNQHNSGYWDAPDHFNIPDKSLEGEKLNGRVYNTTLAALTLMVYYRHLPSYQRIEDAEMLEEEEMPIDPTEEIEVEII